MGFPPRPKENRYAFDNLAWARSGEFVFDMAEELGFGAASKERSAGDRFCDDCRRQGGR